MEEYDVDYMISLIEERPVLWDKTIPEYKNRLLKTESWKEVCESLFSSYEEFSNEKKKEVDNNVVKKWRGFKDNFAKYQKKIKDLSKSGSGAKNSKPYHLNNQLLFLNKNAQNETVSSISDDEDILNRPSSSQQQSQKTAMPRYLPAQRKRKLEGCEFEDTIMAELRKPDNRHVCFFKSILPTVENFDNNQTLSFQSQVLHILTSIQQLSYNNQNNFQSDYQTPAQSGYHTDHTATAQSDYQTSTAQSGYHTATAQSDYQTSTAQSGYHTAQSDYQTSSQTPSHDFKNPSQNVINLT